MLLWSGLLSPFSAKVRIVCAEKGVSYELREIPWSRTTLWGPKQEEFLRVSPRGEVPVLVVGERAIHDSTVIIEYLEERYPTPALLPQDPLDRACCRLIEDDADRAIQVDVTTLVREVFRKPDGAGRDEEAVARATERLRRFYGDLERRLERNDYLCGAFTIADVPAFLAVGYAQAMGVAIAEDEPHLSAWYRRMLARKSVGSEFSAIMGAVAKA